MASPTQRTLEACRRFGWPAVGVVERTNTFSGKKNDLIGCIDVVAAIPGLGCLGIQACASGDHAKRRTKAIAEPRLLAWLSAGNSFAIWSWGLKGERGARKLWALRWDQVRVPDLDPEVRALDEHLRVLATCSNDRCSVSDNDPALRRCHACRDAWTAFDFAVRERAAELAADAKRRKTRSQAPAESPPVVARPAEDAPDDDPTPYCARR
jgi:hypothetical protein